MADIVAYLYYDISVLEFQMKFGRFDSWSIKLFISQINLVCVTYKNRTIASFKDKC